MAKRHLKRKTAVVVSIAAAVPAVVAGATGATAPAEAPTGSIDVWMGDPIGEAQQPFVEELAEQFEADHPDTEINLRFLGSEAHQTYLTSIAG